MPPAWSYGFRKPLNWDKSKLNRGCMHQYRTTGQYNPLEYLVFSCFQPASPAFRPNQFILNVSTLLSLQISSYPPLSIVNMNKGKNDSITNRQMRKYLAGILQPITS